MSDVEFCDTNVLLYAHDSTAPPEKRERAQSLLTALWASRRGCLSIQVLQEFYVYSLNNWSMDAFEATVAR